MFDTVLQTLLMSSPQRFAYPAVLDHAAAARPVLVEIRFVKKLLITCLMNTIRSHANAVAAAGFYLILTNAAVWAQVPAAPPNQATFGIKAANGVSLSVFAANLAAPRGVLVDREGSVWVVEEGAGRISRLAPDGRIAKFADGLRGAHDLELDARGNVYVAEAGAGRIVLISPAGIKSTYIDGLETPVDIALTRSGELVVCELSGARVVAFKSPKERRVLASGFRPHGLAFDKTGTTYINDTSGSRLVKVTPSGAVEPVAENLGIPIGVAIGPSGDLYVADRKGGSLVRINANGKAELVLRGLAAPRDPAFDADGNLYVAETDAGRILKLSGKF